MIADTEPEDGYDATDPLAIRLGVIGKVAAAAQDDADPARRARRRVLIVRLLRRITDEMDAGGG